VEPANPLSPLPLTGDKVVVHCNVTALSTGEMIDSTYERCTAITYTCGQGHAIAALEECVREMRKGQKCKVIAPASLVYEGKGGMVGMGMCPKGSGLMIEMELLEINESLMAEKMRMIKESKEIERSEELEKAILENAQRKMWREKNPGAKEKKEKKEKKDKKRKKVESSDSDSDSSSSSTDSEDERRKKAKKDKKKEKKKEKKERKKKDKKDKKHKKEKKSKRE